MKYIIILIINVIFISTSLGQQNHYIVLQKRSSLGQVYNSSKSFPKKWINDNWNNSYRITHTNFKNGEWFIVMEKQNNPKAQLYRFSPNNQVITDKLNDGYKIEDVCLYVENNKIKAFYVFTKISTSRVNNYYFSGGLDWGPGVDNTLKDRVKDGWDKGYTCDNARSLTYKGTTKIAIVMPKFSKHYSQIMNYRKEFPNDLINNKKSEGYYLSSITYDGFNQSWFVVMTKYNSGIQWTWFNYKSQKQLFLDYWKNKGYIITGVY